MMLLYHSHNGKRYATAIDAQRDRGWRERARYATCKEPPNYPVPATLENADIADNYLFLMLCPHSKDKPCAICIEKYMDGIEYYFGVEYEVTL